MPSLSQHLSGYRRRLLYEWGMMRAEHQARENRRRYDCWLNSLLAEPRDVFLGPDLPYGGVRGHVRAIASYSSLRVQLVPDEKALGALDRFDSECHARFMEFEPPGDPVVHSHVIPWMIRWCRRQQERGRKWVHTYHLPYFPEHSVEGSLRPDQIEINEALLNEARYADIRLSVSRWQRDYLQRQHGIETDYLPNGVDVSACERGSAKRFRRRHRVENGFVLWVGRYDPVKDPITFVHLAREVSSHRFVMIGEGLSAESVQRICGLEAPSNLTFLGKATHAEVQDALAACTALVVTSYREGLPTLVLEAMAQAKPIVAIEEEGSAEALGDGDFGFLVPRGNLSALAETVDRSILDRERPRRARGRILEEYDWRVVAPKLDAIYRTV